MEREGLAPVGAQPQLIVTDEPPCPACGTAAPLIKGACSDCGLQLE
jgi:predicted amidophosphoribosyltransferase